MELKQFLPTFTHRHVLPKAMNGMGPDGCDEVFIEFEARPGGSFNIGLLSALADVQKMETGEASEHEVGMAKVAAITDHCVASWHTNICGADGNILEPTRENLLGLADVKSQHISAAFIGLMERITEETAALEAEDEGDLGN